MRLSFANVLFLMFLQSVIRALFDKALAEIGAGQLVGYSVSIKQRSEDTDRAEIG